jgi:hypothetical protein
MSTSKELLNWSLENEQQELEKKGVRLNELIRHALKPYLASGRNNELIVRCADMPLFSGNVAIMQEVFNDLVRMIMHHPGSREKLLHVKCREVPVFSRQGQGFSNYIVEFHANLTTDPGWMQLNKETIISCKEKLLSCNSVLTIHEIFTSGCLF